MMDSDFGPSPFPNIARSLCGGRFPSRVREYEGLPHLIPHNNPPPPPTHSQPACDLPPCYVCLSTPESHHSVRLHARILMQ
ncbi:hypothetical protein ACOMHN_028002 [Nucella lapillus]